MKTIEERAKEYADRLKNAEISDFGIATVYSYKDVYNANMAAYKRGAEEQKQIDRIHLKKWYCKKICYKRNKCQHPSIMCYRLGKIGKEVFGYEND